MPVDAFVATGARTFAAYLAEPITESFSKAFRQ
jgi:hypothetical protein